MVYFFLIFLKLFRLFMWLVDNKIYGRACVFCTFGVQTTKDKKGQSSNIFAHRAGGKGGGEQKRGRERKAQCVVVSDNVLLCLMV